MHEVAFQEWSRKPKNFPPLGLDATSASQEFHRLCGLDESIVDEDGPSARYKTRVAVKVKQQLQFIEGVEKRQGYTIDEKSVKNASQEQIDQMQLKMHSSLDDSVGASNLLSKQDNFKFLSKGTEEDNVFSGQLSRLGGIKALSNTLAVEVPDEDLEDDEEENGEPSSKKKKGDQEQQDSDNKAKKEKVWYEKDVKIAEAVRAHQNWKKDMKAALEEHHTKGLNTFKDMWNLYWVDWLLMDVASQLTINVFVHVH